MTEDEIAYRTTINVLHDTIESGRLPCGIPIMLHTRQPRVSLFESGRSDVRVGNRHRLSHARAANRISAA